MEKPAEKEDGSGVGGCACCKPLPDERRAEFLAGGGWLVITLFGSIVTNIKADRICFGYEDYDISTGADVCNGYGAYAIATSSVSIAVCVYALATPKLKLPWGCIEMRHAAAFLAVWWVIGCICFTFVSPFVIVGNGYFGCWLSAFASVSLLCRYVPKLGAALTASVADDIGKLLAASLVNLVASLHFCFEASCVDETAWALTCSGVSSLICAVVISAKEKVPVDKISVFLALWWTCGTGAMTFRAPFQFVGNGWFSAWFALLISCKLLASQFGFEPEMLKPAGVEDSFRWFPRPDQPETPTGKNVPPALQPSQTVEEGQAETQVANPFTQPEEEDSP